VHVLLAYPVTRGEDLILQYSLLVKAHRFAVYFELCF